MFSCKRASELLSLAQDEPLSFRQRLSLVLHLGMCGMCRRFQKHLGLIQEAGKKQADQAESESSEEKLSEEAFARILKVLAQRERSADGE